MERVNWDLRVREMESVLVSFLLMAFALSGTAYAGGGKCEGSKFELVISVRHDASSSRLDEWENAFQEASELLYDATDGQHQFGTILVCNNALGGRNADIHLFEQDGRSYVNLPIPGLGQPGKHMFLYGDERGRPFVIVHEFGHYGYGLYDEYVGPSGDAECVESPANATASIMEGGWWQAPGVDGGDGCIREISEFCVPGNHDPDGDTEQEDEHGQSCWETMVDYYPDLTLPAGLPDEGPTMGADDIVWIELEPETRLVLCIDRSGSMNSPSWKMEYAKLAAKLFVDLVELGDKIGVVSYASGVHVNFPLTEVTSDMTKEEAKVAIEAISASGATAMGRGLRQSLSEITSPGDTACQQAIILLSNGFENTGVHPYDVIPDVKEEMTRVFTVGLGDDVDEILLQTIASETDGKYFRVNAPEDALDAFAILSTEVKDGGLILKDRSLIAQGERVVITIPVDNTDEGVAFEATWGGSDLDLTLVKPDGSIVDSTVAAAEPDIEYVTASSYEFYRVRSPEEGEWTMVIDGVDVSGQIPFTAQAPVKNRMIAFNVGTDEGQYEYPEEVLVQAEVLYEVPLAGVEVFGEVIRPDESSVPIALFDDGLTIHGDKFADDGLYSNFFSSYNEDGSYSIELVALNAGGGKIVDGGEPLRPDSLGGEEVDPPPVPGPFRRWASAAVVVSDVLSYDVRISSSDIHFRAPPFPCPKYAIYAAVHCDDAPSPIEKVRVRFYDGDPDVGGVQIGDDRWVYDLSPGQPDTASVRFYCRDDFPHNIYVRIDPENELKEHDEANNEAHRRFRRPMPTRLLPLSAEFDWSEYVFALHQNRPNPFGFGTDISYSIPEAVHVTLKIYDSAGRVVKTLVDEESGPGHHVVHWDGKDISGSPVVSGVYFYQLTGGDSVAIKKLIVLR